MNRGLALLLASALACGDGAETPADAAADASRRDAAPLSDGGPSVLSIDFTVRGCERYDSANRRCTGRAPLTLEFIPITAGPVNRYLWDFGDSSARASERTPSHTFTLPGTFDVRVVAGGPAGSVAARQPSLVEVTGNPLGDPCEVDAQCQQGLTCVCGSAARCGAAFARGVCTAPCREAACRPEHVCADLGASLPPEARPEPWQVPLCVPKCENDAACPVGLRCRDLPARPPATGWLRGCFPDVRADIGRSCRSAGGQLRNDLCLSGLCADLGANGACAVDCARTPCPPGAACARFADGRQLCLRACSQGFSCEGDPLLACTPPNRGPLGFEMATPSATLYCAPRRCPATETPRCPPTGMCREDANGAHCARRAG